MNCPIVIIFFLLTLAETLAPGKTHCPNVILAFIFTNLIGSNNFRECFYLTFVLLTELKETSITPVFHYCKRPVCFDIFISIPVIWCYLIR